MRKLLFSLCFVVIFQCESAFALAVIDPSNLAQNVITAKEEIIQTQQQIQQLQTQLNSYKRMVQDAMNPNRWAWGDMQDTINQLKSTMNSVKNISSMTGGMDQMLSQFGSYDSYTGGSGYGGGHSQASQELVAGDYLGSKMKKDTSDDLLRLIKEQEESLGSYQREFERLKDNAAGAEGQQEAIQATNQFASMQVQLLTQIHTLLMAQNNMMASITQTENNREARDRMGSALQLGETDMFKQERTGTGMSFSFTGE